MVVVHSNFCKLNRFSELPRKFEEYVTKYWKKDGSNPSYSIEHRQYPENTYAAGNCTVLRSTKDDRCESGDS